MELPHAVQTYGAAVAAMSEARKTTRRSTPKRTMEVTLAGLQTLERATPYSVRATLVREAAYRGPYTVSEVADRTGLNAKTLAQYMQLNWLTPREMQRLDRGGINFPEARRMAGARFQQLRRKGQLPEDELNWRKSVEAARCQRRWGSDH